MSHHTTKALSRRTSEGHDGEADSSPNSSLELEDAPPVLALTELELGRCPSSALLGAVTKLKRFSR